MIFTELSKEDETGIREMSRMAAEIVREHFDPIIGTAQNDYMLGLFQTESAIRHQLETGYRYYFVREAGRNLGFLAFYPKPPVMYLSKFYLYKEERGKGISRRMLDLVKAAARREKLFAIELNVNKDNPACLAYESLGFQKVRAEKNDIGGGFFMDDFVYRYDLEEFE